jgi:HD-GYP domain-containing protein (c-di-GMP phosphodiesterase class II)
MNPSPGSLTLSETDIGQRLTHDIVDHLGQVLFQAGMLIDKELVSYLSGKRIPRRDSSEHRKDLERDFYQSFPKEAIQSLTESITQLKDSLATTIDSLQSKSNLQMSLVSNSVAQIVHETSKDVTTSLAMLSQRAISSQSPVAMRLLEHSTHLASLSVAISVMCGYDKRTTSDIGVAGLLHDCSLIMQLDTLDPTKPKEDGATRLRFRQHPLQSAEILSGLPGLSAESLQLMMQVHEQLDGSGYPLGLRGSAIMPGALILNLADAYLSLTMPLTGEPIVSGDAIAYLCYHTSRGKFSKEIFRLFVEQASMYPIGSIVELDDLTKAVVVKGNPHRPLAPIICMDGQEVDLTFSPRFIRSVSTHGLNRKSRRISKQRLTEVLWRLDV